MLLLHQNIDLESHDIGGEKPIKGKGKKVKFYSVTSGWVTRIKSLNQVSHMTLVIKRSHRVAGSSRTLESAIPRKESFALVLIGYVI